MVLSRDIIQGYFWKSNTMFVFCELLNNYMKEIMFVIIDKTRFFIVILNKNILSCGQDTHTYFNWDYPSTDFPKWGAIKLTKDWLNGSFPFNFPSPVQKGGGWYLNFLHVHQDSDINQKLKYMFYTFSEELLIRFFVRLQNHITTFQFVHFFIQLCTKSVNLQM